jgi:argininosuccinate lyase
MLDAAKKGYATATDLADYLVRTGVPFREAHEAVGKTVAYAVTEGKSLSNLSLEELGRVCPNLKDDVYDCLELKGSVDARDYIGGTAPMQVKQAVKEAREFLDKF